MNIPRLLLFVASTVLFSLQTFAQYEFRKNFPNDYFMPSNNQGCHGIAVDPEGKVWIQFYGPTEYLFQNDSLGNVVWTRAIYVFHPGGTPASFSPITFVTIGGTTDTLTGSGRGLGTDKDGNILVSSFDKLYRLNYRTGEGMNKILPQQGVTLTAASSDTAGFLYVTRVLTRGGPINVLNNETFEIVGNVADLNPGYSRSLSCSEDGATVYFAGYTNHCVYVYTSPTGPPGPYALTDSVLLGFDAESFARHPITKHLWASAGSGFDPPNHHPSVQTSYSPHTWYEYDPTSRTILDSIRWNMVYDPYFQRPRAIAFSPTGDTAYVGMFGSSYFPSVQMYTNVNIPATTDGQYVADSLTVLLLHLNEEEGTAVTDSSGYGHDGIVTGTTVTGGKFGRARRFNGTTDRISIASTTELNPSPLLTVEAWIKPDSFSSHNMVIRKDGPSNQSGYLLGFASNGAILNFGINTRLELVTNTIVNPQDFLDGRWHHIAGTYDGSTARVYVDGNLTDTDLFGETIGSSSTDSVHIGSDGLQGSYFDGLIDEVRISKGVRTPEDFSLPRPPQNISVLSFGSYEARLAWENVRGRYAAHSYKIYRGTDSLAMYFEGQATVPFFTTYVYPGTRWYFRVSSVTDDGSESARSHAVSVQTDYEEQVINLSSDIGFADVFSALAPEWSTKIKEYQRVSDGWQEPGGNGKFKSSYSPSGNLFLQSIEAPPASSDNTPAATVAEYRIDRPKNLSLKYGLKDGRVSASASVRFVVQVDDSGVVSTILDTMIANTKGWHVFQRSMSPWSSRRTVLRFITDPIDSVKEDWALWGEPFVSSYGPIPPPKEIEPNNTAAQAYKLGIDDSVDAALTPSGDVDYFTFFAGAGDTLNITSYNVGYSWLDYAVRVHDSSGTILGYADQTGLPFPQLRIPVIIKDSGAYYIRVSARTQPGDFPNSMGPLLQRRQMRSPAATIQGRQEDPRRGSGLVAGSKADMQSTAYDTGSYRITLTRFKPSAPSIDFGGDIMAHYDSVFVPFRINPGGRPTTVSVDYGLSYPPSTTISIGNIQGIAPQYHEIVLVSLQLDTLYYLQIRATNSLGTTSGYYYYSFRTPRSPEGWSRVWTGNRDWLHAVDAIDSSWAIVLGQTSILRTTDAGWTWIQTESLAVDYLGAISIADSVTAYILGVVVGQLGYEMKVLRSTNRGESWTSRWSTQTQFFHDICFTDAATGFLVGDAGGIYRTTNGGSTWTKRATPVTDYLTAIDFGSASQGIAVGTNGTILRTTDGGATWTKSISGTWSFLTDVSFGDSQTAYAVGSNETILRTTNGGAEWVSQGTTGWNLMQSVSSADANHVIAVRYDGEALRTTNGGTNWFVESTGSRVNLLGITYPDLNTAFIVGHGGTILRNSRPTTVAVEQSLPTSFDLQQNFPNPFNPSTTIRFSVPYRSRVHIEVFDLLGQRVASILEDVVNAGTHDVLWQATVSSGVYFYRLNAVAEQHPEKTYVDVKKMLFLK